jgi:hypothetical protein
LKLSNLFIVIFLLFIPALTGVFAQNQYNTLTVTDTIPVNFDNLYNISGVSIIPFSEKIELRNRILERFTDYNFIYSTATFTLSDSLPYSIFDTLLVTYQTIKIGLRKEYRKRSLVIKYDEKRGDTLQVVQSEAGGFTPESIFGPGLQKSGTLIRGFTVGTTKDFSLNSGLRLQLSGNLTEDIEIVAALTDQNTPIQPEGNTERLEEIDKVFIQIKHQNATGTFGDYNLTNRNGEFGVINRKLQGLMGTVNFDPHGGYVAVAGSRGKFNSNNFNGTDGVQGPYRLTGLTGEKDIIVLAGTEKVFVDGIEMVRGENNDYIIEYSNATITFTPKRLITNASRIAVDFEYTDRKFARNFFGTGAQTMFLSRKFKVAFQYLQEGDDQDAPIDFLLSDEDKQILADAGDDPLKAVKPGVALAPEDSLGIRRGIYQAIDTLINNEPFTYYLFNPGDSLSIYNVSFSYVGEGNGDYNREALGQFKFMGIKKGGYLPVIFLPLPQFKQLGNITTSIAPFENVQLDLEYAGSLWDKNRFSTLDDADNYGYAANIFLRVLPSKINIGSLSLGKAGFSYKERFINKRFTSTDRFNEVEFDRIYNTTGSSSQQDEQFREAKINLIPVEELNISSSAGFLKRGDSFKSDRYNNSIRLSNLRNYNVSYNLDYVDTRNLNVKTFWWRHNGDAHYVFWELIKPGFNLLAENKRDKRSGSDSLITGSLEYYELNPYIQLLEIGGLTLTAKYSRRDDYFPLNGLMQKESVSRAQIYDLAYRGIEEVSTTLNLTIRNKNYTDAYKQMGSLNTEQLLIRSQTKFLFWKNIINGDLFYEVSTEKQARLEKVFVRVEQGTGNYKYLGDLNNNGIADENEFEPTLFDGDFIVVTIPTDELFPVINLKTNTRWKITYSDIFDRKTFIASILDPLSTETSWRIEEITRETDLSKIYLLQLSYFQQPGVTIRGANFLQQDVFINENRQDLSFRFRFSQRTAMSEFNTGVEKGYNRERSLRVRFRLIKEVSNQTDFVNITDNVSAPQPSTRNRRIVDNNISTDFSYRPISIVEVGFRLKVGRSEDTFPASPTIIDLNSQLVRLNLSFLQAGRLRFEAERTELIANTLSNLIPYEMLNGNQPGKNYYWRLNFDYRIASFLQTTLSYDGRWQGKGRVIHTARAEARAYF